MAAKRRKIVTEDVDLGYGPTTIPTDSGGLRVAAKLGLHSFMGAAYLAAHDQPGTNAGDKIKAAIAALPSTGGIVDARGLTGAQTCNVNPFAGITTPVTLLLGDVVLSSSVQWKITTNNQNIIGSSYERTFLTYSGGSLADFLLFDGTLVTNNIQFVLKDLTVSGNASVTNAVTFLKAARFTVENVQAENCTGSGFMSKFCVLGVYRNPSVSANLNGGFSTVPSVGMTFDDDGTAPNQSSANTIINALMEGITTGVGIGIREIGSQFNVYLGGSAEGCVTGLDIGPVGTYHKYYGLELEANSTRDIICRGFGNEFLNTFAASVQANAVQFTSVSYQNRISGGRYYSVTVDASASLTQLDSPYLAGALTDNGTNTIIRGLVTLAAGGYINDKIPNFIRALTIRSTTDATPTNLTVMAHASAQGTTDLISAKNSAGALKFSVNEDAEQVNVGNAYFAGLILGSPDLRLQYLSGGVGSLDDIDGTKALIWDVNSLRLARRFEHGAGSAVAAANDLTLGLAGNYFQITGNTQINAITTTNWQAGSVIWLQFTGTPTVKHATAGGVGTAQIFLQASADLVAAVNVMLELLYNGTNWQEISRKTP